MQNQLRPYSDPRAPAIFLGCRQPESMRALIRHRGLAVLLWQGPDSLMRTGHPVMREKKVRHVARSCWIADDLQRAGLPFTRLNIPAVKLDDLHPVPLGEEIYVYAPRQRPRVYRHDLIRQVRRALPGVPFYVNRETALKRPELIKRYRRALMGIRLTQHDGVANTVLEMGMMGRRCVYNGDEPNAIPWETTAGVVSSIQAERELQYKIRPRMRAEMEAHLHQNSDWLQTGYWAR